MKRERNKNHKRKGFGWARILGFSFIYLRFTLQLTTLRTISAIGHVFAENLHSSLIL